MVINFDFPKNSETYLHRVCASRKMLSAFSYQPHDVHVGSLSGLLEMLARTIQATS